MLKKESVILGVLCLGLVFLSGCSLMKAEMKLSLQRYDEAIPLFKEYLADKPDSVEARSRLGFACLKTGRLDEAIAEFKTVLKAEPGEPYSVLYLGLAYLNKGELGKTIEVWQGYRDKKKPLVEEEIKRQLTLLRIAESQRLAKKALMEEEKLKAVKPEANTIAVCYYQDLSPDKSLRAFQKGLAAMVITDLSKIKSIKVVERLRLQALLEEMKLGQTGIVDERTAPRVGRLLGAENLIVGNLLAGSIEVNTSVVGNINGTASVSVEKEKFYELPGVIVRDVAKILGIDLTPEEVKAIGVPHTTVYKAFIYFGKALDALDAGKWQEAKNLFDMALKEDPKFALAGEGSDSCPGADSPDISGLSRMAPSTVEAAISAARAAQSEADAQAAESTSGGGGGG
ncbi:MAG: tetratricopeptide repeat protein [Deltaproteobacteria bacterium]|nr:tetratricopeptide repeat protein [Deltaproteobacteria bacterium]MBW2074637.1 tetratricopeptide repeat protein [Deltaproteobacteria bacterium]